ncbi:acyl-CoA/acyl-ACP dehydrogenase [Bradyrhizobium sp. WSM 1704]|uniref:acyl-CoA dehydrogenase family protein n=1 Tax=Bradyrhizobium semiaridum TaxID=2821404 RepID=UPI001CE36628|nr:acyl-CoA dehydrogenase family protein [Bradyrhizobium semiaridum]MCA6123180.1 acyl-CoA/acyl-ACP dehydrogenase [Bradyrhizobium semiaridum]
MSTLQDHNETGALLNESAGRLFASVLDREIREAQLGEWPEARWRQVEDAGFALALVREEAGGFGVDPAEAVGLLRIAGSHAAPVPLAETMLANRLLTEAGFEAAPGPATIAPVTGTAAFSLARQGAGWRVRGSASGVPWARHAKVIAALADHDGKPWMIRLDRRRADIAPNASLAGLPSDVVKLDAELSDDDVRPAPSRWTCESLTAAGAALRVAEMAGALERVLEMTVTYANERVQFGKPIGKQQAVQQLLAVLAGQVAACGGAAAIAGAAFDALDILPIAAAKVRAGEAVSIAAPIAHQVHGAIGFTEEHRLHFFTRRLWTWRDEFGPERHWSAILGRRAIAAGADGLWPFVTSFGAAQEAR